MRKKNIVTSEELVRGHQTKGIAIISAITWLFLYNLLPEDFWSKHVASYIPAQVQYITASMLMSSVLLIYFYYSDPLFKRRNSTSDWIKTLYASNLLIEKFGLNLHEANALWFKYLNQWQHKEHPNHSFLKKSHSASYNARLVYFIILISLLYAIVAFLAALYSLKTQINWSFFILSIVFALASFVLYFLNRPPKLKDGILRREPAGVWRSVEESFLQCRSLFELEIVSKCKDVECIVSSIEIGAQKWIR
ncbi:hypothetical protein DXV75_16570 [Alteromonas aestuariivivens]|uniref:Uncharacterized protein n=1 Tax=Alteromonas aestuariivivens TaxID=1938339 RepID=A0A3D8M347_9ALTE|nr:hypothetical protein [Alteromonas aestuariivivens]RDV23975.1 hypothetical protein DXV75_16570 [Alteromonas aestuariivivens]